MHMKAEIAKDAIASATRRFPAQVWAFMEPGVAADIKVAFAIEHAVSMMTGHNKTGTVADVAAVTAAIRGAVYNA